MRNGTGHTLGLVALTGLALLAGCSGRAKQEVVVYVSEDQVFAEPVLKAFERATGIVVRPIFDTEEAKSTGVMNRLLAEQGSPQADVYWANEPIRAELLRQKGVAAAYFSPNAREIPAAYKAADGSWTGFSARARVLIVRDSLKTPIASVQAYTNPAFRGRAAIANPLFGTTTAYVAALYTLWGDDRAKAFLHVLKQNGVRVTGSNGESADLVAAGEVDFSLVDSDDAFNRLKQGKPVHMVVPDQAEGEAGVLLVPNAAILIKGGPHPENGRRLVDYLLSKETERTLAFADCAQIPLRPGVETPAYVPRLEGLRLMSVDYARVAATMEAIQPYLKAWAGY
jgi:iron(III) transport system substrate-binding protein